MYKDKQGKVNYRIRSGDSVVVIAGKDKGRTGKILSVDRDKGRVIINGINLVKKHRKPLQEGKSGEVVKIPASMHISNVMYYDNKLKKGVRVRIRREGGKKIRYIYSAKNLIKERSIDSL